MTWSPVPSASTNVTPPGAALPSSKTSRPWLLEKKVTLPVLLILSVASEMV
jgi:hypothetical protein